MPVNNAEHIKGEELKKRIALLEEQNRRLQESLESTQQRYRELYEGSRDGYALVTMRGNIVESNSAFKEMLGYTDEELRRKTYMDITPRKWHAFEKRFIDTQVRTRGYSDIYEKEYIRKDGTVFPVEMRTYLRKENGIPAGMWAFVREISARKEAELSLMRSEEKYRLLIEHSNDGILIVQDGYLKFFNKRVMEATGFSDSELKSRPFIEFIYSEDRQDVFERYQQRVRGEPIPSVYSFRVMTKESEQKWIQISAVRVVWEENPATLSFLRDITEMKKAETELKEKEEQVLQLQRIEAVGRLAGGVAHDFNNILTAIMGYTDILLMKHRPDEKIRSYIERIKSSSQRASQLTQQLLAFSRKQILREKSIRLDALIGDTEKMLRRLIGEDIALSTCFGQGIGIIRADPAQIEQIVINCVLNARDAMPDGGTITVRIENVWLDDEFFLHRFHGAPGMYVMIEISDTGHGMTDEVREHIFEPFFTTKEKGKGTGLGLSTVYGIVKQSRGYILVESTPKNGTTFRIYFPVVHEDPEEPGKKQKVLNLGARNETILLVEDEYVVRSMLSTSLRTYGYHVLESENGGEAIKIRDQYGENDIHLLVTDVIMPGMSGKTLADTLLKASPNMKILYISGYTDDAIVRHGVIEKGISFLQKPFAPDELARKVREILDNAEQE
jgi:two-component system cell cycle sensor histidine kinase/response regulator CckA